MDIIENNKQLGELKVNTPYAFHSKLVNDSENDVAITLISPSCGSCTVAHVEKTNLSPNDSADLVYTFTPNSTGFNSKRINVTYTELNISYTVTFNFSAQVIA